MATVTFADAEDLVIGVLDDALTPPVSTRQATSGSSVRVLRTGGTRTKVTDRAQLTIESYADLESHASNVAKQARSVIHSLPGRVVGGWEVYRVEEASGPANLPDPRTNQSRYTQTQIVHIRIHEEP